MRFSLSILPTIAQLLSVVITIFFDIFFTVYIYVIYFYLFACVLSVSFLDTLKHETHLLIHFSSGIYVWGME